MSTLEFGMVDRIKTAKSTSLILHFLTYPELLKILSFLGEEILEGANG